VPFTDVLRKIFRRVTRKTYKNLRNEDCAYITDKAGDKIEGERKETEFWSPKAEALCCLRWLLLKRIFRQAAKMNTRAECAPQMLLWRERGDDLFQAGIVAER
jgi:hypothetical protein